MPKYVAKVRDDFSPPRPKSWAPSLFVMTVLLLLSPILLEGGLVVYGKWQVALGRRDEVRTPVLDYLSEAYRELAAEANYRVVPVFNTGVTSPQLAVPVVILVAAMGVLVLRKGP